MGNCAFFQNSASICKDKSNTIQLQKWENTLNIKDENRNEVLIESNVNYSINYLGSSSHKE